MRTSARIAALFALPAAIALVWASLAGAAMREAPPSHDCTTPAGSKLVARNTRVLLVVVNRQHTEKDGTTVRREWRYCHPHGDGRFHRLVLDGSYNGGYGDIVTVDRVVLSGMYAAYVTRTLTEGGRDYGAQFGSLSVRNLQTGSPAKAANSASPTCGLGRLVLTPNGVAAAEVLDCYFGMPLRWSWQIQALDGRTGAYLALDATPFSPSSTALPDPFASLALYQCAAGCAPKDATIASWTRDGSWHSTLVP